MSTTVTIQRNAIEVTATPDPPIVVAVQPGYTDHGLLTGLGDDDHPHYLTQGRGDARYALAGAGGTPVPTLIKNAGAALGGHRAVWIDGSDLAQYADAADASAARAIGITSGAVSSGAAATIQYAGEVIEPTWTWTPGAVYVGSAGQLTQTPPAAGVIFAIGIATAPTRLVLRPHQPLYI